MMQRKSLCIFFAMKYPINFYTSAGQGTGYGGSAEFMAAEMERSGSFDLSLIHYTNVKKAHFTKKSVGVLKKPFKIAPIALTYGVPHSFEFMTRMPHKFRIGFTMFETDSLPKGQNWWNGKREHSKDIINQLDLLLVPCEHNKEMFRKEGVTIPIEVIHLGVHGDIFYDMTEKRKKRRTDASKPFTFLMSGDLTHRKNAGATLIAYMRAFGTRQDVKLVFKTTSGTMRAWSFPNHNIEIIDENVSTERMAEIYGEADCFVFPSRGEGFGLTPLEAMSTGLYSIFPDHTGMSEYINPDINGVLKNNKLVTIPVGGGYPAEFGEVGKWYEADVEELANLMTEAESNKEATYLKGEQSVEWAKKFNYERTVQMIKERAIEKYYDTNKTS